MHGNSEWHDLHWYDCLPPLQGLAQKPLHPQAQTEASLLKHLGSLTLVPQGLL